MKNLTKYKLKCMTFSNSAFYSNRKLILHKNVVTVPCHKIANMGPFIGQTSNVTKGNSTSLSPNKSVERKLHDPKSPSQLQKSIINRNGANSTNTLSAIVNNLAAAKKQQQQNSSSRPECFIENQFMEI